MRILITGISGTVGNLLAKHFVSGGHGVTGVTRRPSRHTIPLFRNMDVIPWQQLPARLNTGQKYDAVINCSGAAIIQRWSRRNREVILNSRLHSTQLVYRAVRTLPLENRPECIINMSSIAIYGNQRLPVDESFHLTHDTSLFQSELWRLIESLIDSLTIEGVRSVMTRLGVVIGADKNLHAMLVTSSFYLGAIIGDGRQKISWISAHDLARVVEHIIVNTGLRGPVNVTSPNIISATSMARIIAHCVDRPVLFRIPAPLLRLLLGRLAETFETSAHVISKKLLNTGFDWHLNDFAQAIDQSARQLRFPKRNELGTATKEICKNEYSTKSDNFLRSKPLDR